MKKICLALAFVLISSIGQASYTQQFALGGDSTFQGQIQVAMIITAANVMSEVVTTTGHVERASFAAQVLQNPAKWTPILSYVIASQTNNPMTPVTVPSTVADSLIQTAMDAQWTNVAGYFKR